MGTTADKLTYLNETKMAIKEAIIAKGGDIASDTPFREYADKISELPAGVVDKRKFGLAIDDLLGNVNEQGEYIAPSNVFDCVFTGVRVIRGTGFTGLFRFNKGIRTLSFPDLEEIDKIGLGEMCKQSSLERVFFGQNIKKLMIGSSTADGYAFEGCQGLVEVDYGGIEEINGGGYFLCGNCKNLKRTGLRNIRGLGIGNASNNQTMWRAYQGSGIEHLELDMLEEIQGTAQASFSQCLNLVSAYFPMLSIISGVGVFGTSSSNCIFYGNTNLVDIHFRKNMEEQIKNTTVYQYKLGATNATIYFDIVSTITVNDVVYARSEKDSPRLEDYTKTYIAWKSDGGDIVYTDYANNAEPDVDTVVYSDAGITQVGTVSAIE